MTLTSIKPGDLVRVDDGLVWYARVMSREPGQLRVSALTGALALKPRNVKASEVTGHWRKSSATQMREAA